MSQAEPEKDDAPNRSLVFSNRGSLPLLLVLEPHGEDFWILPGKQLLLRYKESDIDVDWSGDAPSAEHNWQVVALYGATEGDWAVYENGEQVECGHNRPLGWK